MASMIRSSDRMGPDRVMCCSRTEMTVELRRMSGSSVDPSLAWGNGGGAGSMRARPSHRRTDYQPSREKRLGFMLRRPSWGPTYSHLRRNFFCKIGSASASKTPQRSRSGIYLTFSTTESGAFDPKGPSTKKLVVGARPITLALEADRRIRIGADHLAFRRYHGGARRSLRRAGRRVRAALPARGVDTYRRRTAEPPDSNS